MAKLPYRVLPGKGGSSILVELNESREILCIKECLKQSQCHAFGIEKTANGMKCHLFLISSDELYFQSGLAQFSAFYSAYDAGRLSSYICY
jgi:hypothetical protein